MKEIIRALLQVAAILVVLLPVAIVVTLLLSPLWPWIEDTHRIESIGHSGPADWCFVAVYSLFALGSICALWFRRRRERARPV